MTGTSSDAYFMREFVAFGRYNSLTHKFLTTTCKQSVEFLNADTTISNFNKIFNVEN